MICRHKELDRLFNLIGAENIIFLGESNNRATLPNRDELS